MFHTTSNERLERKTPSILKSAVTFSEIVKPIFVKNSFKRNFINFDWAGHVC